MYLNEFDSPHYIPNFNPTLYLVTDSSLIPPGTTLASHVEKAIRGGVTVVQLREKNASIREFIKLGKELHAITQKYKIPLIINDRVDVALAVGCEGVHIGWDDMDYETVRKLVGPTAYVGVSISNESELDQAFKEVSKDQSIPWQEYTYFGIGPVYATATKPDHKPPLGVKGMMKLLEDTWNFRARNFPAGESSQCLIQNVIPCVAIGGINKDNVRTVRYPHNGESESSEKGKIYVPRPDGIAVVSAIMTSSDPEKTSKELIQLIKDPEISSSIQANLLEVIPLIFTSISASSPLIYHITNDVVKNISANVTLAIGASPIMSENSKEVEDLARINSSLVVNMGTASVDFYDVAINAIGSNGIAGKNVVFDPVGAGATEFRKSLTKNLLNSGYSFITVIKGNRAEILTVAGETVTMKGVDSGEGGEKELEKLVNIVRKTARLRVCIVVMTGKTDIISDGSRTVLLQNGHEILGAVTGTGCSLASVIAACLATNVSKCYPGNPEPGKFERVVAAVLAYTIASEFAWESKQTSGPGSFQQSFLDALYIMARTGVNKAQKTSLAFGGKCNIEQWIQRAKITIVD